MSPANAVNGFFETLSDTWRGLLALAGAFSVGGIFTIGMLGFIGLPDEVRANTEGVRSNQAAIAEVREVLRDESMKLDRIICILEAQQRNESALDCEATR